MPNANNEQLRPPRDWDEFEDICADLFSLEWGDPHVVRYGRSGQSQNGVDIYGKANAADAGVQCKSKREWPPTELTIPEIDAEIEKAKNFSPKLKTYIIVTTAENDARVTDHVNAVSAKHAKCGLFSVHVYGWMELTRRIRNHPKLLEKHFDICVLRQLRDDNRNLPDAVAARVVERIRTANVAATDDSSPECSPGKRPSLLQVNLADALERDFASRFTRAIQRSLFPEMLKSDEFVLLGYEVLESSAASLSTTLRRAILLRAARSAAIHDRAEEGQRFLSAAEILPGSVPDGPARARLAVACGNNDEGIQILRDAKDDDSCSVLLSILATARGNDAALQWFAEQCLSVTDLTPNGVLTLCQIFLRRNDLDAVKNTLSSVTPEQLSQGPYLYFLRGAVHFASLLPVPEQATALNGLPLDVRNARPIFPDPQLSSELDVATNDFRQVLPLATALGLREAPRIIESYLTWCELLHPGRKQAALAQLRRDLQEPTLALSRVHFAFAYDPSFDPAELEQYLQQRDTFGGLSDEELRAALSIRLNQGNARGLAELIASKREQAEASFGKTGILSLEIQALAKSGDATSAKIILEENLSAFDVELLASLRTEIAKAEGADPATEHLQLYEDTKTTDALRALVGALIRKNDNIGIARYAELLYADTKDPRDIAFAAGALIQVGDGDGFVRVIEAYPAVLDVDFNFTRHYGWQLFRLGRQGEAKQIADRIAKKCPQHRELHLETAIALETGEWETLAKPLAAFLEAASNLGGLDLIRAARLAQACGHGPLMDLVDAALKKGDNDPNVLFGAYSIFVEEGLEEERPEAHESFRRALALSGPDGPIQAVELKELLSKQTEWNEHSRQITDNMARGEMPLSVAGIGLRATIVDLVLRNLVRNSALIDGRRRAAIPLFTGRRLPVAVGSVNRVAFDITSLLVLGWLGILPKTLDAFSQIVLPAGALTELFEGRRRVRQAQRSRLRKAVEIRDAIAGGHLKVLRSPSIASDPLSAEVGVELAALLREAEVANGIVVRPAPVRRLGIDNRGDADMSAYSHRLSDMHTLLETLADLNVVDEGTEKSAKQYFTVQDKAWRNPSRPDIARPVFVDRLSLVYLQETGLLQLFFRTFSNIYIHASTEEEATVLIEHDRNVTEVLRVIDDIRNAVRRANAANKVTFGPRRTTTGENDLDGNGQSTLNLLTHLSGADAAVLDDRALNKEPFATDTSGHRAQTVSTLDIIEELTSRGVVNEGERRSLRYRLRIGGAMLIPADVAEFTSAAKRNRQNESPEFRAIHDSIDLARLAEMPQFPGEMPWFISLAFAIKGAIIQIWNEESEPERARSIADAIMSVRPLPEDWVGRWAGGPPPAWIPAVRRALSGGLALPIEITDKAKIETYQTWLEAALMSEMRSLAPETYQHVVGYLRDFIQTPWEENDKD